MKTKTGSLVAGGMLALAFAQLQTRQRHKTTRQKILEKTLALDFALAYLSLFGSETPRNWGAVHEDRFN